MRGFTVVLAAILAVSLASCKKQPEVQELASPDKSVKVRFELASGVPTYSVAFNGAPIINDSKLGFLLKDSVSLNSGFEITSVSYDSLDETWEQPWGEVKSIRNNYRSATFNLAQVGEQKLKLAIEFRVFNDGVGFRYILPGQAESQEFQIIDETTEFNLSQDMTAWWQPAYRKEADIEMDSEFAYRPGIVSTLGEKVHTPLTLESGDSLFVSIHEAALLDFPAMTLAATGTHGLKSDLVPWPNGVKAEVKTPFNSPWRTIQIAKKPGDLITSYLILNLNEPNKLGDVSWIKPGKYVGMWWGMHMNKFTWNMGPKHGATTKNVKALIDFASAHKIDAVLVEGWNDGWQGNWSVDGGFNFTKAYDDYDLAELSTYARAKNIGIVGHHETGGNIDNYEKQMEDAFKLLEQYGIQRLKTGYVNKMPAGQFHQGQFMVRHYNRVMEMSAKYHVMLDVHEPIKDTGLRRTWPNMMTREGVRGTEYEAWSVGNSPAHTATLPFTRGLAGPIDYTPGIFNILFDKNGKFRVHTTLAKQLALYVVIYSPMQMAADLPENYTGKPAFKFIEDVPADWEFTQVLEGKIGSYVTTVRKDRNSGDWYLGSITDESPRTTEVALNFLAPGKKYRAEIYQDGTGANVETNPLPVDITSIEVTSETKLPLTLAAGGGTAIRFTEVSETATGN